MSHRAAQTMTAVLQYLNFSSYLWCVPAIFFRWLYLTFSHVDFDCFLCRKQRWKKNELLCHVVWLIAWAKIRKIDNHGANKGELAIPTIDRYFCTWSYGTDCFSNNPARKTCMHQHDDWSRFTTQKPGTGLGQFVKMLSSQQRMINYIICYDFY